MPRYQPSEDEMEGLYPSESAQAPEEGMESKEPAETIDSEEAEAAGETALIDNNILSPEGEPLKEGDKIILEVVKNYGGESEVKYATTSSEKVQPPGGMGMMDESNAELDRMSEE